MNKLRSNSRSTLQVAAWRHGVMLPLIALLLPVVLVLMGFAVDLAYMQNTRMELRAATDAAARAAATTLSQTDDDVAACSRAKQIASMNYVAGKPLQLSNSDVSIGRSEPNSKGRWEFTAGGYPPNSVRIEGRRTAGSLGGPVPLFFGSLIGRSGFEPQLEATASFLNVDVCLVLDKSTSMKLYVDDGDVPMYSSDPRLCNPPTAQSRWIALDGAVRVFVQTLRNSLADEHVALVTYSGKSGSGFGFVCGQAAVPSTLESPLDGNLALIEHEMDRLKSTVWNGFTYIESGMQTGISALTHPGRSRSYANKIMIVLTDGYENLGSARDAAQVCQQEHIIVNAITFGDYADQETMIDVASIGGGKHYHATTSAGLEQIFRELAAEIAQLTE